MASLYRSLVLDLLSEQEASHEQLNALEAKCTLLVTRLQEARDRILDLENERALLVAELRDVRAARAPDPARARHEEATGGVAMAS